MELSNFWWGFLGGFIVEFYSYLNLIRAKPKRKIILSKTEHDDTTDYEEPSEVEPITEREYILGLFRLERVVLYIASAFVGAIMASLINPQIPFFAFYIGLTSAGFISRFSPIHQP